MAPGAKHHHNTGLQPTAESTWGHYGRRPALVLAGVGLIDSIEKGIVPGVLTDLQDDLGFSDFQAGLLQTVIIIAGLVMALPAGYWADRHKRTLIIGGVLTTWGLIAAATSQVRAFWHLAVARGVLGAAEAIDNPSSSSLLADYYPADQRPRAYAMQRAAPILGTAIGIGVAGGVAALTSWRWAFVIVGLPGSLFAYAVLRLPEPPRGGFDEGDVEAPPFLTQMRELLAIRSFRVMLLGAGIATGGLSGLGFWSTAFFERHSGLSGGAAAGITGGVLLVGAFAGTLLGGNLTQRLRQRYGPGAALLQAPVTQSAGAILLLVAFFDVPTWTVRIPLMFLGVPLIVCALPGLSALVSEVTPPTSRGLAFSAVGVVGTAIGAVSPPAIGLIADQFEFMVDGETKGNLAVAFRFVIPGVFIGAFIMLRGRRWVDDDIAQANTVAPPEG